MGGSSISAGQASFINLRIDNRTEQQLYIAYRDEALQGYADVRNFSAEFNQWVYFNSGSNDPITLSAVENLCLVIDSNNNLVMAYRDPSVNGGLTMFKYNVNTVSERFWKLIDRRGISSGGVSNLKMAAGLDGKVYLAFSDLSKNGRLTVSGIYPDNVDHIVLAVENMLKESTPFNETTIGYVDFANANYSPAPNNWSSVIWSSGAIGPGEIGTFMAVSSSSSVDNSIIVYNLPAVLTIREFNAVFSSYGTITYSRIFTNRKTQLSEGFGIVTYQNRSSALNAIKPLSQGGRNGFLLKGQALFIENGVPDRAVSSYTGVVWTMRQTIRDVGAGSYQAWFSNGHPKFEKRYDFDGEITAVERYYSKDGQWSKEIEHIGLSRIREFLLPTKINIYEVYRRFFDTNDDELIDREELLCGIRSFNLNVPDLPVGSSPLDMVFNRMMPNNSGLVDFKGFARVLPNDVYTRDIANNIGFDRAILVRDAESTNGLKDGIMTEYESSLPKYMLVRTANFKMDVLNGMEMTYYTDSSLRSEVNYVNGRRVGMYREYYPREYGILRPKLFQEYDERGYETPVKSTFYPSGDTQPDPEYIAERFVDERDPKIKIRVRTFWPGAIPRSIYYTTETNIKTGLYIEYGITGALVQTGTYDQNRKLGRWETIFETPRFYIVSGAKRVLENYVQGKLSGVNAVQVFNEAGIRIFVRSYPNVV
jgi:antitoxin component YwqK of YwqJK toxin-antitoxin module